MFAPKTVADPAVLRSLVDRLSAVGPDSRRRWGTMTAHETLCHLGDASEMVLLIRPRKAPLPPRRRPLVKWLWLWSPMPWPHGVPTNPMFNPKADGTRPSAFERDRARAVAALERIARAEEGTLEPVHGNFGTMSVRDWQRWAYRHTNHHLRQFGH